MSADSDQAPGSVSADPPRCAAEALAMISAGLDYLNSPAAGELAAAALGDMLTALGQVQAKTAAAHAAFLRRFDVTGGPAADGYGSAAAWLAAMTQMTAKDARAAVRQMRRLGEHPGVAAAMTAGQVTQSCGLEITDLVKKLPADLRVRTGQILLDAATAGASLDDLKLIAAAAYAQWRARHPDPGDDGGFDDRHVSIETTFGGAAVIRGDLTPECGAAVQAVLEALGKKHGPEDDRSEGQRFHDALQLGCELLIRARMVPDRAGADTQVMVLAELGDLRQRPGGSQIEQAWLGAGPGGPGFLAGKDAETAACDAMIIPVVTGRADMSVIDRIIDLALAALDGGWHRHPDTGTGDSDSADRSGSASGGSNGSASDSGDSGSRPSDNGGSGDPGNDGSGVRSHADSGSGDRGASVPGTAMTPGARDALRYAIARLAIDFVSGPGGLASCLRTGLLDRPYSTPSLPLDIGFSQTIPASIRRAVQLRDKGCAWPRCGRPIAWCDVHHLHHKKDGGKTSVRDCVLLCQFHQDICIHRLGWRLILHPDGTTTAYGPRGQVLHSHSPPTTRAG